jgi:putative RecB family exonuclease
LKNHGSIEPLEALQQHFEDCLTLDLENTFVPVIYKRDLADKAAAIEMGKSMLETFHNSIDLNKMEIVDVEVPLSCTLHTDSGAATDYKLFGILDLILRDASGELIIVDLKTSSKGISQAAAIEDTQLSAYAYLVSANPLAPAKGDVNCQFFVLRKLRQPRLEQISTVRTAFDRKRFARMANAVLAGIDAQIYMPQPSWMCGDCGYSEACKAW